MRSALAGFLLIAGFALPLSAWAVDTDGDGVDDSADAFPTYPEATTDTDGDGQPDVLNNIIFQDFFNGAVEVGWTGVVTTTTSNSSWSLGGSGYTGSGSLLAKASGQSPAYLTRSVTIPASGVSLSFWHKLYSGGTGSYSYLYIDNVQINNSLFTSTVWRNAVYALTPGTHTLTWKAVCGNSAPVTVPCGYLDDVKIRFNSSLVEDTDDDNDGVLDAADQCPLDPACSVDTDGDGIDNVVDTDDDNDAVLDVADNCPINSNADQLNTDGDAQGNVCDTDDDNDGVADTSDKFPLNAAASSDADNDSFPGSWNAACDAVCQSSSGLVLDNCPSTSNVDQLNTDGDAQGNVCDTDDDNDGVLDTTDQCPLDPACSVDTDGDGIDNVVDTDDDNDAVLDVADNCPINSNADQLNTDGDAQGNVCDTDDDNDGVVDGSDQCPLDPTCSTDTDGDGIDNTVDTDDDNDGLLDGDDNCPINSNADQLNTDGDAQGNVCDTDDDNDGVADTSDKFPLNVAASSDADNDGFAGSWNAACDAVCQSNSGLVLDNCPSNANANQLNTDGDTQGDACDTDDDNDGVLDTTDQCPLDPACTIDTDGDGIDNTVDTDDDNDGLLDGEDNCPINSNADQLNTDGDALGNVCDTDDDNDGVADTSDKFPLNIAASSDTDNDSFPGSWNAACDTVCQSNSGLVLDNCPSNANANQLDTDGDTQGDVCDTDDDNDGVADLSDKFPLNAAASSDIDADGFPRGWHLACDLVCQSHSGLVLDNCPTVANANQLDTDGDGAGDVCDNASYDNDDDGVNNFVDNCPNNSNVDQLNADGDSQGNSCDTDDDNDGVPDASDACPLDATASVGNNDNDTLCDLNDPDDDNDNDLDSDEIAQGNDPLDKNSNSSVFTIVSFENGLPAGWTKPAAANVGWVSDATQASHLTKSLRTAATGNSQKAQVQMTAYFSGTSFSFDVKVSTESNNDNFRVYVDGAGQVTKSGELGWQTITVPITAGTHTVKFEYLKNSSIASGSDAVWIDKFSFSNGDVDNDGQTNAVDLDDDNDGAPDYLDPEPLNAANSSVWPLNNHYQGSAVNETQAVQ